MFNRSENHLYRLLLQMWVLAEETIEANIIPVKPKSSSFFPAVWAPAISKVTELFIVKKPFQSWNQFQKICHFFIYSDNHTATLSEQDKNCTNYLLLWLYFVEYNFLCFRNKFLSFWNSFQKKTGHEIEMLVVSKLGLWDFQFENTSIMSYTHFFSGEWKSSDHFFSVWKNDGKCKFILSFFFQEL